MVPPNETNGSPKKESCLIWGNVCSPLEFGHFNNYV
jgi:hypothetical protein